MNRLTDPCAATAAAAWCCAVLQTKQVSNAQAGKAQIVLVFLITGGLSWGSGFRPQYVQGLGHSMLIRV